MNIQSSNFLKIRLGTRFPIPRKNVQLISEKRGLSFPLYTHQSGVGPTVSQVSQICSANCLNRMFTVRYPSRCLQETNAGRDRSGLLEC